MFFVVFVVVGRKDERRNKKAEGMEGGCGKGGRRKRRREREKGKRVRRWREEENYRRCTGRGRRMMIRTGGTKRKGIIMRSRDKRVTKEKDIMKIRRGENSGGRGDGEITEKKE